MTRRGRNRPAAAVRRRTAPQGDSGLGLPELLVTMMLVALMSLLVTTLFVTMSRAMTDDKLAHSSASTAAIAMNEMSRVVRGGAEIRRSGNQPEPAFSSATATSLTVTSYVDTSSAALAPVKVTFALDADGALTVERRAAIAGTSPYWTFASEPSSRVIARDVVRDSGKPLFTYLGSDGKPVTAPCPGTGCGLIRSVQISVEVQSDPKGSVAPVLLQNTVGMPNLSQTIKDTSTP